MKYTRYSSYCSAHLVLYFDLRPGPKILFQGNTPEGSDTFQRPVIERDRVGGLRLMIWDKVKVSLCHYSHAPEESNLWTAWQLFLLSPLCSLSNWCPWKRYEPLYLPRHGLDSTPTVLLQGSLWHWITHKAWYAIKQKLLVAVVDGD